MVAKAAATSALFAACAELIIEDELSAMPSGQSCERDAQSRQQDAEGQDSLFVSSKPKAEIGAKHRQEGHRQDKVSPARWPCADARHKQQFDCSGNAGQQADKEPSSDRPKRSARPECIARPPIKYVGAERAHCQRNRESNQHGMKRMPRNCDARFRIVEHMRRVERIEVSLFICVRRFHRVALLAPAALLAGCGGPLSTLDPAGSAARDTLTLLYVLLVMAAGSFLVIFGLFLLAFRRDRGRRVSLHAFLVWGGLVFPIVLLTIATVYGVVLGERIRGARGPGAIAVEAQAERWRWRFTRHTPSGSRTVEDRLDIPAGRDVEVTVTSVDVIHSFWAPRLGGKIDAVPGSTNRTVIRADAPGRYAGVCAEFCGTGHTGMSFTIVAHDSESWAELERGIRP